MYLSYAHSRLRVYCPEASQVRGLAFVWGVVPLECRLL